MKIVGQAKIEQHMDIAPLVDVVFLLLIFFMLTSTFLKPQSIELQLPGSSTAQTVAPQKTIDITLTDQKQILINNQPVQRENLTGELKQMLKQHPEHHLILRADSRLSVQEMMQVMDQVRLTGTHAISLMTQQAASELPSPPNQQEDLP